MDCEVFDYTKVFNRAGYNVRNKQTKKKRPKNKKKRKEKKKTFRFLLTEIK